MLGRVGERKGRVRADISARLASRAHAIRCTSESGITQRDMTNKHPYSV